MLFQIMSIEPNTTSIKAESEVNEKNIDNLVNGLLLKNKVIN